MTRTRSARIALFTLIGIGLIAAVVIVFGASTWHERDRYEVDFDDTVYGLERGGDVYCAGVRVGNVASIDIDHEQLGRVRVGIVVDRGTPIRGDTLAYLIYAGVTGIKEIDLRGGTTTAPPLPPGHVIAVGRSELDDLESKAKVITDRAVDLLDHADKVASNLADVTDPRRLGAIVGDARKAMTDLAAASANIRAAVAEDRSAARDAAAHANDLLARLDDLARTSSGPLRDALGELARASRSIAELAREVRESPSRLLFSRPPANRRR